MIPTKEGYDRLEYYTVDVAADRRRKEFDIKNHCLISHKAYPDFVFIGDSITHYWELNVYFHRPGQLIVNRGIGGDTTTYLKKRFWVDALQLKPKYCIAGIGINDSIDLEGDYWKLIPGKPYSQVLITAKENILDLVAQAKATKTTLILTSLLPIHIPVSLCEDLRKQFVRELNSFLKEVCILEGLIFVDYFPLAVIPGTDRIKDGITYDGIHPNAIGYDLMASVLTDTLKQHEIIIQETRAKEFDNSFTYKFASALHHKLEMYKKQRRNEVTYDI